MLKNSLFLMVVIFGLAACAYRMNVSTGPLSDADFASYQTYSFMPGSALVVATSEFVSPLLEDQLKTAATRVLTGKGFRTVENPEDADFVVAFVLGARDQVKVNSYPKTYRESWRVDGAYTEDMEVRSYTEGTLSVDIFEVETRRPVWHGRASRNLTGAERGNVTLINDVVAAILSQFPPP